MLGPCPADHLPALRRVQRPWAHLHGAAARNTRAATADGYVAIQALCPLADIMVVGARRSTGS